MKTVMWLYLFIFIAFFDLHAQFPMLTPFAISLGAAPSFIGFIMGIYSLTHLPGNWIAGFSVDKYGSKPFIVASLLGAGALLIAQGNVTDPWQLLVVRSISGFVLAFLSPACLALLAKMAKDHIHQSKLMAGNGLVHTLASVVSPAVGAFLVSRFGFTQSFVALGWGLLLTGILAFFGVRENRNAAPAAALSAPDVSAEHPRLGREEAIPWLFYGIPLALSCSQGILFFEIPLLEAAHVSLMQSGVLFSIVSFGALITLAMVFLTHVSPHLRVAIGSLALALIFFGMAVHWPIPFAVSLLLIGMTKGVIFPAMAALLASITTPNRYGRVFSVLSISFSVGAFLGPILAGQFRDTLSPYYIAFSALMTALIFLPPPIGKKKPSMPVQM